MTRIHSINRLKVLALRAAPERRTARLVERLVREPGLADRLERFGFAPVDVIEAPVESLLVQRPVRCEVVPVREATTLPFLDAYFTRPDGTPDWRITKSMQYRLLEEYKAGRLPTDRSQTDYSRWHQRLREAGIDEEVRDDAWIERKIGRLIATYDSIAADGYRYGDLRSYVWVLGKPLIQTRYSFDYAPPGYEIFHGHHRAAAAAAAGYETLHVLLLRDVGTETPFGIPLRDVVVAGY